MEEDKQTVLDEGPERFDPMLLTQSPAVRVAWFEKECTIEHTSLLQARDAVLRIEAFGFGHIAVGAGNIVEPAVSHDAVHIHQQQFHARSKLVHIHGQIQSP